MLRRSIGLLAFAALPACASTGGFLGARPVRGSLPSNATLHDSVHAARVRLDSAAQRGDATALARLFTEDAVVVVGEDTLRGWGAVSRYYSLSRPSAVGGHIEFRPKETELCIDGAYEIGGLLMLVTRQRNGAADTLQPNYAVRWVVDASGAARIRAATLQSQVISRAIRAGGGCQAYLALARFPRKRVLLSIEPPMVTVSRARTFEALKSAFTAAGYAMPGVRQFPPPDYVAGGVPVMPAKVEENPSLLSGALRARGPGPLTVELAASILPSKATVAGFQQPTGSHVTLDYSQRTVAVLVGAEWRRFRVLAGPALVRNSWVLRERRLQYQRLLGYWYGDLRTDESWSNTAQALMVEAAWTWAFNSSLFAEIRGSWRSAKVDLESPTTAFPSVRGMDAGGYTFGVAFGVAP